jgi:serine/threonine protein phosphatase PrpC
VDFATPRGLGVEGHLLSGKARVSAVRVEGTGASHEGPIREVNEDAFAFVEDRGAALAVVADGMGREGSGRSAADIVTETCTAMFRVREKATLDELAEVWWKGEHVAPERSAEEDSGAEPAKQRVRPYHALPIGDRASLRERVELVLARRVPESMGDLAVLDAEAQAILGIPRLALTRVNSALHRRAESNPRWRGYGATAACVIFAAGQASIAHVGECRVSVLRVGSDRLEPLTTEHTLLNDYRRLRPDLTPEEIAELPEDVVTRALGMGDAVEIDTHVVPTMAGDVFVVSSDGFWKIFSEHEVARTIRERGIGAAPYLVARGARDDRRGLDMRDRYGDNLTAVVVHVVEVAEVDFPSAT